MLPFLNPLLPLSLSLSLLGFGLLRGAKALAFVFGVRDLGKRLEDLYADFALVKWPKQPRGVCAHTHTHTACLSMCVSVVGE